MGDETSASGLCPFINLDDPRCASHFSLRNLRLAFDHCQNHPERCQAHARLMEERCRVIPITYAGRPAGVARLFDADPARQPAAAAQGGEFLEPAYDPQPCSSFDDDGCDPYDFDAEQAPLPRKQAQASSHQGRQGQGSFGQEKPAPSRPLQAGQAAPLRWVASAVRRSGT